MIVNSFLKIFDFFDSLADLQENPQKKYLTVRTFFELKN